MSDRPHSGKQAQQVNLAFRLVRQLCGEFRMVGQEGCSSERPSRPSAVEQPQSAAEGACRGDEVANALLLEAEPSSGDLDGSTAVKYSEYLANQRASDAGHVATVATLLTANLQRSLLVDRPFASELAYTTLIGQMLDNGDAESAQYLVQEALTQLPESSRIRAALATAMAERLFYREAISVLR